MQTREGGSYGRERGEGVNWRGGSNPSVLPGRVPEISPWGEVGCYYQLLDWISGSAAVSCPTHQCAGQWVIVGRVGCG